MDKRTLIKAEDLSVWFEVGGDVVKAVDGVSIHIKSGERVGLVGESGSGKSILCRAFSAILPEVRNLQLSGSIIVDSLSLLNATPRQVRAMRKAGVFSMIFQDPLQYLNPTMKVGRQIDEAIPSTVQRAARKVKVSKLLGDVGLATDGTIERKYPHELSGGMRQRVLIAIALANDPKLLIADEPTTALDLTIQAEVLETLNRIQRDRGMAILLITHDLSVISEMCDRVYVMYKGKIVEESNVFDLFDRPEHPYTQGLIRSHIEAPLALKAGSTSLKGDGNIH